MQMFARAIQNGVEKRNLTPQPWLEHMYKTLGNEESHLSGIMCLDTHHCTLSSRHPLVTLKRHSRLYSFPCIAVSRAMALV
jgi:hypothetical protein